MLTLPGEGIKTHGIPFLLFDKQIILTAHKFIHIQIKSQEISKIQRRPNFFKLFHINVRGMNGNDLPSLKCTPEKQSKNIL